MTRKGFIAIIVLLLGCVALTPVAAFAADTGTVSAQFTVGQPPVVNSVSLTPTAMTPQTSYSVAVNITDSDHLSDLAQVVFKVWYDANGGAPLQAEFDSATANTQTCAVITWTPGGSFVMTPSSSTSWILGSSVAHSPLTDTTGTFTFIFSPGKVATETAGSSDKWQLAAKATDTQSGTGWNCDGEGSTMNWYGQITVPTSASVNFGTLLAGTDYSATQRAVTGTFTYVANGAYAETVKTSATWSGVTHTATLDTNGDCTSAQQFALKADDSTVVGSGAVVNTVGATIDTGALTAEAGVNETAMNLWMKLASGFDPDLYSGTITYSIVNN